MRPLEAWGSAARQCSSYPDRTSVRCTVAGTCRGGAKLSTAGYD